MARQPEGKSFSKSVARLSALKMTTRSNSPLSKSMRFCTLVKISASALGLLRSIDAIRADRRVTSSKLKELRASSPSSMPPKTTTKNSGATSANSTSAAPRSRSDLFSELRRARERRIHSYICELSAGFAERCTPLSKIGSIDLSPRQRYESHRVRAGFVSGRPEWRICSPSGRMSKCA